MVAWVTSGSIAAGTSPGLGDGQSVSMLVQAVAQPRDDGEIRGGAVATLTGDVVEHVGRHAVARRDEAVAAEDAVPCGVAAGEEDRPRDGLERRLDDVPGEARGERRTVHARPGLLQQVDRFGSVVGHADPLEHLERLLVDEVLLRSGEIR